ncbi:MAG TPA: hypothetical protein ENG61_01695 [Candidatus Korarchaeota archaeon]|nr:hypothetical protein [Candidatus Korarchaeota archaeon]
MERSLKLPPNLGGKRIYIFFIYNYRYKMGRSGRSYRSLLVTREVYERLRSLKREGESFSDLIARLMERSGADYGLEKLAGLLSENEEEARLFEEAVKEASKYFGWTS